MDTAERRARQNCCNYLGVGGREPVSMHAVIMHVAAGLC